MENLVRSPSPDAVLSQPPTPDPRAAPRWMKPRTAVAVLVVLVALGILMTRSSSWHAGELAIDQAVVDAAPRWMTGIAQVIGVWLSPGGASFIIVVIAAVTLAVRRRWSVVLTYLAVTVVPWLATEALKLIVQRPRPAVRGVAPISTPWTWSYPSGHAAVATALVIGVLFALWPVLQRRLVARRIAITAGVAFVGVVAVSRVVLAVHYPTDVIAGPLCATAFAVLVAAAVRSLARRAERSVVDEQRPADRGYAD